MSELIAGFGGAVLGAAVGFIGSLQIERNRTTERRRGILATLEADLSSNVIKMRSMQDRLRIPIEQRPFDLLGPPTTDFWTSMCVEIASLLPLDLFVRLHMAYEELGVFRTSTSVPPLLIDVRSASAMVDIWVESAEQMQDELLATRELTNGWQKRPEILNRLRESSEKKKAVLTQRALEQNAINDLMNGNEDQTK